MRWFLYTRCARESTGTHRTFKGFLKDYCRELSGLDTTSLRRLVAATADNARLVAATADNARLVGPLFALAAVQGKMRYLVQISEGCWFRDEYENLAGKLEEYGSIKALLSSGDAPARYATVLDAYCAQGNALAADRRINGLLRLRIVNALNERGLARYRLCKDLALTPATFTRILSATTQK